jgi:hypothetical protein
MNTDGALPHDIELVDIDAEDLLVQVHRHMGGGQADSAVTFHGQEAAGVRALTLRLRQLHSQLEARARELGDAPPAPSTPRARVGSFLISVLQRVLWWHTRSMQRFADLASRQAGEEVVVLERIARNQQTIAANVEQLQHDLARVEARLSRMEQRSSQPAQPLSSSPAGGR